MSMRIARDIIVALRYKFIMFGLLLSGTYFVIFYNQVVVNNTSLPQSTFVKETQCSKLSCCTQGGCIRDPVGRKVGYGE